MEEKRKPIGYKSPSSRWCMLRDSSELRTLIHLKMKQRGYNLVRLSKAADIHPDRISKYFNKVTPNLTQFQIIKLANFLGIEVKLDIKVIE